MEWISAKERMPPDKVEVLAYCKRSLNGYGRKSYLDVAWYNSNFDYWENLTHVDVEVTHWMPLPEPPQLKPPSE